MCSFCSLHCPRITSKFLANVNSRYIYAFARPSVVCNVRAPYSAGWNFPKRFYAIGTMAIHWHHGKFYRDRPKAPPPSGELNARGYPNIAILDVSKAISRKQCKVEGELVLITNTKSYMSFRLVPKSVTLNDHERHKGPYFASFHRIR